MQVRVATPSDVERIVPMMEAFNRFESIAWTRERGEATLLRLLGDASLGVLGLLEHDGETCGYFVVTWGFDLEWNGRDAVLTELWLEPHARGRGLAREAIAHVERIAVEHGAHALHLMVRHENLVARRVYDAAGFREPPRAFLTKQIGPRD